MASSINASTSGAGGVITTADNTGILNLQTGGTTAVTVNASQNVGIGTTSPATKLQVVGASGSLNARINAGNTGLDITSNDATGVTDVATSPLGAGGKAMTFTTYNGSSSAERMRIDSSGNVGIGTTSPVGDVTRYLNIVGAGGAGIFLHDSNQGVTATDGTTLQTAGTSAYLYNREAGFIAFGTSNTERMRIDSGGAVLMGKTTTDDTNVGFAYRTAGYISVVRSAGAPCYFNRIGTDGAVVEIANDSSTVGTISVSGSSTSYNTSSDYRLKENIVPMTGALDKVAQLKPVTYTWKIDGKDGQGFIAHELQAVVPDAVTGEKDAVDDEGNPVYQGVDTSFLVATLTAAIQELTERVKALEAK